MYADFVRACEAHGVQLRVVDEVPRMVTAINLVARDARAGLHAALPAGERALLPRGRGRGVSRAAASRDEARRAQSAGGGFRETVFAFAERSREDR
ncbi:hypothetical protein [Paraburkholderia ferrariae]|uniref:hypothetical protein n=1 Tax=Paraburkholderia ferrariae TaxID=386056 RepID=UPI003D1893B6